MESRAYDRLSSIFPFFSVFITAVTVLTVIFLIPASVHSAGMTDLLPEPDCARGWTLEERPVLYGPDTLYDRINGESELFLPYGFEKLAYGRYVSRKNPRAGLEADIYAMGSVIDAFGIFSNYRRPDDTDPGIGTEGSVSSSQLIYYQDRFFVRLQVTGSLDPEQGSLMECAKAVSWKLPQNFSRPRELEPLMLQAVVPKSGRYVAQSLLGYAFFRRGLVADAILDGRQITVFIVTEDSPKAAAKALELYISYLNESGKETVLKENHGMRSLSAVDPLYKKILVVQNGRRLIGAVRFGSESQAEEMIGAILKRLSSGSGD